MKLIRDIYTQIQIPAKRKRAPGSIAQDDTEAEDTEAYNTEATEATKGSDEANSA